MLTYLRGRDGSECDTKTGWGAGMRVVSCFLWQILNINRQNGLPLILAIMHQCLCRRVADSKVFIFKQSRRCSQIALSQQSNPLDRGNVILSAPRNSAVISELMGTHGEGQRLICFQEFVSATQCCGLTFLDQRKFQTKMQSDVNVDICISSSALNSVVFYRLCAMLMSVQVHFKMIVFSFYYTSKNVIKNSVVYLGCPLDPLFIN